MGEIGGLNFFLSHPLPQNPLVRSRDFDGFEVIGGPPKTLKFFRKSIVGLTRYMANYMLSLWVVWGRE